MAKPESLVDYRRRRLNTRVEDAAGEATTAGQKVLQIPKDVAAGNWGGAAKDVVSAPLHGVNAIIGGAAALPASYMDAAMRGPEKAMGLPEGHMGDSATAVAGMVAGGPRMAKTAPVKAAQRAFSPATVSQEARDAAMLHRKVLGERGIQADIETHKLAAHAKTLGGLTPEAQSGFLNYVENRSQGAKLKDPRLQGAADAIRGVSTRYRARIEYMMGDDAPSFIKDYYAHMWQQKPEAVEAALKMAKPKQGSGRNLRARTVPTYADGLAAGLTPRFANPVDAMIAYNENMAKFLGTHEIRQGMVKEGLAQWYKPGEAPPGWVELKGAGVERVPKGVKAAKAGPDYGAAIWGDKPPAADPMAGRRERTATTKNVATAFHGTSGDMKRFDFGDGKLAYLTSDRSVAEKYAEAHAYPEGPGRVLKKQVNLDRALRVDLNGQALGTYLKSDGVEEAIEKARRDGIHVVVFENTSDHPLGKKEGRYSVYAVLSDEGFAAPAPKRSTSDKGVRKQVLYAPPDAARIYNNNISQGLGNNEVYKGARAVSNAMTQAKLGLSAFHLSVMGREGIISEMAKGIGQASRGKMVEGAKSMAKSPAAPVATALRGRRMFNEIVGVSEASPEAKALNSLYAKSGGRLHMDRIYSVRGAGSFYNSLKRGTFKQDVMSSVERTYQGPALERAKGVADMAGNMIQSVAAPLFEDYVPAMKRGAWASRMEAFLRENPGATDRELTLKGQEFLDNIDNRFGELMVDNNFWHKAGYQISQLLLLSPSWNLGTVREIGGGLADIPKSVRGLFTGKGVTDKTAYLAALGAYTMIENGIMTKLKTGDDPDGLDWFSYRTGGVNPDGSRERAQTASYMKDIMALMQGEPGKELVNKANPGVKAAYEAATNSDWRGDPIYPTHGEGNWDHTGDWVAENFTPIGVESFTKGDKQGSNLSPAEKLAGTRPAAAYIQNPERVERQAKARTKRRWDKARRNEAKDKAGRKGAAGGWKVEDSKGWTLN